jgi:hypothetical protein
MVNLTRILLSELLLRVSDNGLGKTEEKLELGKTEYN